MTPEKKRLDFNQPQEVVDQGRRKLVASAVIGLAAASVGTSLRSAPAVASTDAEAVRPFRVNASDNDLNDLRQRIRMTRWPDRETVSDQSQGIQLERLKPLVEHWGSDYDWRKAEAKLNVLPQYTTNIDGLDIHFIHVRSKHPNALPVIITHGWPGSIFENLKVVGPLTDPTAQGGHPEDAFDVVIPSMPGYGFSGKPTTTGWGPDRIARVWAELMKRLGYQRYVAQGGDWGSPVSSAMARLAPEGLLGIHINLPAVVPPEVAAVLTQGGPAPDSLTAEERATFDALNTSAKMGNRSYAIMMGTRPQTVGYGLTDSPAGLAAWMLGHPGFSHWSYSNSDTEKTLDEVLDDITLYWLTNSAISSARLYWETGGTSPAFSAQQKTRDIALPVAITVFPGESYQAPESWARRAYPNLSYFHIVDKGGHFAAWEEPELFSAELRSAFRSLR
ncbi:epoxide hydrolase family protein [Rhizobium mesoamericanum]|uniref:Epoxide hydrolase domain protein n=1 Tax=Rhizobium mesoamericanum STM3625 TaxID=1211777 RepID=K0Q585_9HYPH|nr:epoxide hydrolase family protein [Rhizobium mesoamericanum]CCM78259.1 Epoxide hydrolase domain protein [Rhizobium mesoamericanum STM3625]